MISTKNTRKQSYVCQKSNIILSATCVVSIYRILNLVNQYMHARTRRQPDRQAFAVEWLFAPVIMLHELSIKSLETNGMNKIIDFCSEKMAWELRYMSIHCAAHIVHLIIVIIVQQIHRIKLNLSVCLPFFSRWVLMCLNFIQLNKKYGNEMIAAATATTKKVLQWIPNNE